MLDDPMVNSSPLRPPTAGRLVLGLVRDPGVALVGARDPSVWPGVIELAGEHRVLPLVLEALLADDRGLVPLDVLRESRDLRRHLTMHAILLRSELERAVGALTATSIPFLILKGRAIALCAYPRPDLRHEGDIDLLVPSGHYLDALGALQGAGFTLKNPDLSAQYHRPYHFHDVLLGRGGALVELHWGLSRPDDLFSLDAEAFLRHGLSAGIGVNLPITSPTDLLLHTAAQSLVEGFLRLGRVCDADRLVRRCGERIDATRLVADARRGRLGPSLWLLLDLARSLFGTPAEGLLSALRPGRPVVACVRSLDPLGSLVEGPEIDPTALRHAYAFWLAVGPTRRTRALARTLRLQALQRARLGPRSRSERARSLAGRIRMLARLLAFQAKGLVSRSFARGDEGPPDLS